jgi:hypothetical protein
MNSTHLNPYLEAHLSYTRVYMHSNYNNICQANKHFPPVFKVVVLERVQQTGTVRVVQKSLFASDFENRVALCAVYPLGANLHHAAVKILKKEGGH